MWLNDQGLTNICSTKYYVNMSFVVFLEPSLASIYTRVFKDTIGDNDVRQNKEQWAELVVLRYSQVQCTY